MVVMKSESDSIWTKTLWIGFGMIFGSMMGFVMSFFLILCAYLTYDHLYGQHLIVRLTGIQFPIPQSEDEVQRIRNEENIKLLGSIATGFGNIVGNSSTPNNVSMANNNNQNTNNQATSAPKYNTGDLFSSILKFVNDSRSIPTQVSIPVQNSAQSNVETSKEVPLIPVTN